MRRWPRIDNVPLVTVATFVAGLSLPSCSDAPCIDPLGEVCQVTWEYQRVSGPPQAGTRIDLDGDGRDEVALVSKSGDLLWLTSDFPGPTTIYDVGTPTAIVRVDIDGDSRDDLFVAGSLPAQLLPFYSNGDGTLIRGESLPLERPILEIVAHDLDGDGTPELVAVDGEHLLIMDTNGSAQRLIAGSNPIELELGDLNDDGEPDAVVLGLDGSVVSFLNDGARSFTAGPSLVLNPGTRDLEVRDVDGDDRLDVLVRDRLQGGLRFAAGDGAGTFSSIQTVEFDGDSGGGTGLLAGSLSAGSELSSITMALGGLYTRLYNSLLEPVGYIDRPSGTDARFELLGEGFVASEGSVALLGTQRGPAPIIIGETELPLKGFDVLSADFDGDSRVDLAVAHTNCTVSILHGLGDGSFAEPQPGPTFDLCPTTLRAADIDHDGHVDLVGHGDSAGVQLALGDGLGGFSVSTQYSVDGTTLGPVVDGEPRALLLVTTRDNELLPLAVDTAGELHPQVPFVLAEGSPLAAAGDLDGDGDDELLLRGKGLVRVLGRTGNELSVVREHALTDLSTEFIGLEYPEITFGDYDGDDLDEVLLREENLLVVVDGLHSATPQLRSIDRVDSFPTWASGDVGVDIDGDGHLDHAVFRLGGDFTYVRGDGLGFTGPPYTARIGWPHSFADLDGNGRADLLLTPGYSPGRTIFRAEARDVTLPRVEDEHQLFIDGDHQFLKIVDGDLDGDGYLDIVIGNGSSLSALWGAPEGFRTRTTQIWGSSKPVVAADLSGDGYDTLISAASSPSTALLGASWERDKQPKHFNFQVNLDHGLPQAAAAADFDGDDLVDLAVAWGPTDGDPTMGVAVFYAEPPSEVIGRKQLHFARPRVLLSVIHPKSDLLSGQGAEKDDEEDTKEEELPDLALQAADLDGDGRSDLLFDSDVDGSLKILWNEGEREFTTADLPGRSALVLKPGVILTIAAESLARHNIYGRRFGPAMTVSNVGTRRIDAVTECNGDGVPDLRMRGGDTNDARFMLGVDNTFLDYPIESSPIENTRCIDQNSDGVPDLVRISQEHVRIALAEVE